MANQPVAGPQAHFFSPAELFNLPGIPVPPHHTFPVTAQDGPQPPFAPPPCLFDDQHTFGQPVRCIPLVAHPVSTKYHQTGALPTGLKEIPDSAKLRFIRHSSRLWTNLVNYTGDIPGTPNTWDLVRSGLVPQPNAQDQARAIYNLANWFAYHCGRQSAIVVNCEMAVQDEIALQIVSALNVIIRVSHIVPFLFSDRS